MVHTLLRRLLGILFLPLLLAPGALAANVWVWGDNTSGQLGLGHEGNCLIPTNLMSLGRVIAVSSGAEHTLALRADGTVWAWGKNASGQLGDDTTTDRLAPVQVKVMTSYLPRRYAPLRNIIAVAAGGWHSLALDADGTVWAWGSNAYGQTGHGSTADLLTPLQAGWKVEVPKPGFRNLTGIKAIAAGREHSLAVTGGGKVYAWGSNDGGQIGPSAGAFEAAPVQIPDFANVVAVAAGGQHSLALKADGTVWAFGWNIAGQLGDNTNTASSAPVQVRTPKGILTIPLTGISAIAAGRFHSLALSARGRVYAWGYNADGELGLNTTTNAKMAALVTSLTAIRAISAGENHSMAIGYNCRVYTWGHNASGQLGNDATAGSLVPVSLASPDCITQVSAGGAHTMALRSETRAFAWGWNNYGQLGNGTTLDVKFPVMVRGLLAPALIESGWGNRSFAVDAADGIARAWGKNDGVLGDGGVADQVLPVPILVPNPLSAGAAAISGGIDHAIGLDTAGVVWTWGSDAKAQLGDGGGWSTGHPDPRHPSWSETARAISAGNSDSFAVADDGTLWVWGNSLVGALGTGIAADTRDAPYQLPGFDNVIAVDAGYNTTHAVRGDGTVWSWGLNDYGLLGIDSMDVWRVSPAQTLNLASVKAIAVGAQHALALKTDGTVWAWGSNGSGQLGNGTATGSSLVPVQVSGLYNVKAISAGPLYSLALTADGQVWGWGYNANGEMGVGAPYILIPTLVPRQPLDVTAIAAGNGHSRALAFQFPEYTPLDLASALKIAGGLATATKPDALWLNVVPSSPTDMQVDLADAAALCRWAAGLTP